MPPAAGDEHDQPHAALLEQVNRVEQQGVLLLRALRWLYLSLGSFAAASRVTLLGAVGGQ